jgi:hypothetical protein
VNALSQANNESRERRPAAAGLLHFFTFGHGAPRLDFHWRQLSACGSLAAAFRLRLAGSSFPPAARWQQLSVAWGNWSPRGAVDG